MTDGAGRALIVSAAGDWSAEQVVQRLDARGAAWSWLDPADFPQDVRVAARLGRGWQGSVATPHGAFRWEEVTSVFYRRPRDFAMPAGMSEPEKRFARAQARVGLGGVLASLPARWINHPSALADCEYKPWQLNLAATVGLPVPATVVTNDPEEVRTFVAEVGEVVVKPLAEPIVSEAGGQKAVWTRRISSTDLTDLVGVELTMHLVQQWIPKACDVRLTVVGPHLFPVAIHAHSETTRIDWRTDYDALTYEVIDCPPSVSEGVQSFLKAAGLTYGAFDFAVAQDTGEFVFLECNGAGQWGWLAEECGLPIADAIADELIREET